MIDIYEQVDIKLKSTFNTTLTELINQDDNYKLRMAVLAYIYQKSKETSIDMANRLGIKNDYILKKLNIARVDIINKNGCIYDLYLKLC